ncbi:hypothetical protein Peur_053904 [Populus x canadensis]
MEILRNPLFVRILGLNELRSLIPYMPIGGFSICLSGRLEFVGYVRHNFRQDFGFARYWNCNKCNRCIIYLSLRIYIILCFEVVMTKRPRRVTMSTTAFARTVTVFD